MNALILFEDEHLLVVNKPSGVNTHKPDRFAPDGIHEWLCKRSGGRGSSLAAARVDASADSAQAPRPPTPLSILHRLDKDTSGVILFGKTTRANQSLSRQFESHRVEKQYLLLSAARPTRVKFRAKSVDAVTEFELIQPHGRFFLVEARPITGKTHQIRQHASENGFPVVGDTKYGGEPAPRLMLHAHKLTFEHPARGERMTLEASVPVAFEEPDAFATAREFRELLFGNISVGRVPSRGEPCVSVGDSRPPTPATNAFRLISGTADGFPDVIVDSYAGHLLVQWQTETAAEKGSGLLEQLRQGCSPLAIYEQLVTKQKRTTPKCVWCSGGSVSRRGPLNQQAGAPNALGAPLQRHTIRENGLTFLINFGEGLSTGIFLDQRENRRRLLAANLAGKTLLNCFSYTCAFSVAAAKAGARTTSIDLSRKYLEWGKENLKANGLGSDGHEFLVGDVFEWLKRLQKRGQTWDIVILDPPTFSTTKQGRAFRAERDYEDLEALAMGVVAKGGTLLCSTNQRMLTANRFEALLRSAARAADRVIESVEFETLPFDFRVAEGERAYLKTLWARLD